MPDLITAAIARLTDAGLVQADQLKGCAQADIETIQAKYDLKLPATYRDFLTFMGRSAGKFLMGTDYLFPDVLTLREQADRLLRECEVKATLGKEDFVFAAHQGYQFLFFNSRSSPDPEIFLYEEGEADFRSVADSFSKWFADCVQDEIEAFKAVSGP